MFQNSSTLTRSHHALPNPHPFPVYASLASKRENLVLQKPALSGKAAVLCLLLSHNNNYCQRLNYSGFLGGGEMLLIAGTLRDLILLAN